ncbi:MAG TPA: BamA/TamA family outer membrane protein [Bacteroidia bacterium]|nr:BamA/TamA family outer membrane protein [Bacteroidia bacterium]
MLPRYRTLLLLLSLLFSTSLCHAQNDSTKTSTDSLSKFDAFNAKMEALFKVIPVPIYSHSTEAGDVFGLAKFNLINLSKLDTVSCPSKISEVATVSTKGRVNISVSTDLIWHEDKYMVLGFINYKLVPEYILGIGNDVSIDDIEEIETSRFKFMNYGMVQIKKDLYIGAGADITIYEKVKADSNSFLYEQNISGIDGGTSFGIGPCIAWDHRDSRYNPFHGTFLGVNTMFFPDFLGNPYIYSKIDVDARTYFNPWLKHVIALQATTSYRSGDVPFYELSMLGGDDKMRGYYKGALRDRTLVDGQIEYRFPIWNIFGAATWIGTGRVAEEYSGLTLDGFWLSYGAGLRIKVDSKNNTNMRFDFGFGPNGVNGFYINFAEAF